MIDEQDKFIVFIIRAKGLVKRQVLVGVKNRAIMGTIIIFFSVCV